MPPIAASDLHLILLHVVHIALAAGVLLILFVPFFPGLAVILGSVLVWVAYRSFSAMAFAGIAPFALAFVIVLSVVGLTSSWWSEKIGLRFYYMSQQVMWGAIMGSFIGILFFQMPGFLIGLILGTFAMELREGKKPADAFRQGLGSLLSLLGPRGFQLVMALMVVSLSLGALH